MSEEFNGWANRETWAFNLHWSNDEGMYNDTLNFATEYLVETYGDDWAQLPEDELSGAFCGVGEHVVSRWQEVIASWEDDMGERLPEVLAMFRDEVGSWWRIDCREVGGAVRESLGNES